MPASPDAALSAIEQGKPQPVYWIYGEENFFSDRLVAALKKTVVTSAPDFNFDRFEGKDVPIAKVIGAACSHPVMAPRRLVLVKGAEAYKAEDLEPLAAYCEKPLKTTCLVFVSSDKADLRRKFFKSLDAQGGLVECRPLWESEVGSWISRLAKEKGCKVEPAAHALFLDYVGTDLLAIGQTIEKASLLAGEGKAITEPIAEQVVALSRQAVIWDVFDAAAEGRVGESLVELQKLLAGGEKPAALLPGLWWVFRRL
ncbi:MAG: DNA polymerase III subunit delta, partial [Bdellovibrionota bacterium]